MLNNPRATDTKRRRQKAPPAASHSQYSNSNSNFNRNSSILTSVVGAGGLLLASQALYIALCTPRLPPPENSGPEFCKDGLLVYDDEDDLECRNNSEFRLVLIGDSPVEGIGNPSHSVALGGQTAFAFSRVQRRPVRYWSYGRSGLTAEGIRREMVPYLRGVLKDHGSVDAVVISCGVNNVLFGQSAGAFRREMEDLLGSVVDCCTTDADHVTSILVMELLDFALMPFLPWPFSKVCSWRSCSLQREMENVVLKERVARYSALDEDDHIDHYNSNSSISKTLVGMAYMPKIEQLLHSDETHPLLDHVPPEEVASLELNDFFADDNFHPAGHGTIIVGKILADTHLDLTRSHQRHVRERDVGSFEC